MNENDSNASSVPALVGKLGALRPPLRDLAGQIVDNAAGSR